MHFQTLWSAWTDVAAENSSSPESQSGRCARCTDYPLKAGQTFRCEKVQVFERRSKNRDWSGPKTSGQEQSVAEDRNEIRIFQPV